MKLTIALLTVVCLHTTANGFAQGITLNEKNAPVEKVFKEITRQTGYVFFYVDGLLNNAKKVTVVTTNSSLDKTLSICFSQLPFSYSIVEKTIVVSEKTQPPPPHPTEKQLTVDEVTVSGKITDNNNAPLSGASIAEKGTEAKTLSKEDGSFSLSVSKANATLIVSYIGYQTREIALSTSQVSIVLQQLNKNMDEVVVIGYQSVRRKDLTGTVSSISGAQLEKIPVASAAEAITGRLPGVQVTTVDGQPGADIVIRVRGGGSITGSNDPLYIVDGFRVSNINDIAPSDIASIDILKDAATAAIYGAAAANGVVIVTTKSAKGGKSTISYNGFMQARQLPRKLAVLSPYEFVLAQYEYARIQGQSSVDNFAKYFGVYEDLDLYKYTKGTDWQNELYGSPAWSQQHNISLTGGTDKTKFALNFTNNKEAGLIPTNSYTRNYINFKLNHEVSQSIKIDAAIRYTHPITNGAGSAGSANFRVGDGITTRPVNGIADMIILDQGASEEYEQFLANMINPVQLTQQDYRRKINRQFNFNAGATWSILRNLTFRSEYSLGLSFNETRRYYGPLTSTARNEGMNLPMGEINQTKLRDYRLTNTLNYRFNKNLVHDFTFLVGQEMLARGKGFEEYNRAKYFNVDVTPEKLFATMGFGTTDIHTTTDIAPEKTASFFGRVIYQYNDKYIFNLTGRYDGSTQFAPGKQWGLFPAASFAWRISSEEFMTKLPFITDLKLRASYGSVGNNNISSDQWRMLFKPEQSRPYGAGETLNPYYTFASTQLTNPEVKWETTITRNIGLDFGLLNNRIAGTLDFYHNTTKDLLVQSAIPPTSGFSTQQRNIGQTSNRGIELGLNADIINKADLTISFNFNIGVNRARIDKLDGVDERTFNSNWAGTDLKTIDDYRLYRGQTIGLMYGYVTEGMYTVDDFTGYDAATKKYILADGVHGQDLGGISLRPGVLKLKDLDSSGTITADDRTVIGRALPKATGGFGFNV
ncbi:SusC/RagA family TonB-linked outer membrane protein [Niastella sp. OAS944]